MSDAIILPPGPLDAEWVEDVFAVHHVAQLQAGTYTLSRPLRFTAAHSGLRLVCPEGGATVVPGWAAPDPSLADDPTNTMIGVQGTLDTSAVNTYLAAITPVGALAIGLHAAVTVKAGTWLVIEGNNPPGEDEEQGSQSGTVIQRELVQVAADVNASATIPLKWPTAQHHASGAGMTVKGVHPVTDLQIEGITLDPGAAYIATGINVDYAHDLVVSRVRGGGFTFSMVRAQACSSVLLRDLHDTGGGHGLVALLSVLSFTIRDVTSSPGPRYVQPYGIPRAKLSFECRPSNGLVCDVRLCHGARGILNNGGHHITFANILIEDFDGTSLAPVSKGGGGRDPETGQLFGVGIYESSNSIGPTGTSDLSAGCRWSGIKLINCYDTASGLIGDTPENGGTCAWWHHGATDAHISDVQILNLGADGVYNPDSDGVFRHRGGFFAQDDSGSITDLTIRGCFFALYFNGTVVHDIGQINIDSAPGYGGNVSRIFLTGGGNDSLPRIRRLNLHGSSLFLPSAGWVTNPDNHAVIDQLKIDTANGNDVIWARSASSLSSWTDPTNTGNGAVMTDTGAGTDEVAIVAPTAGDTRAAVLVMQGAPTAGDTRAAVLVMQGAPAAAGTGMLPVSTNGGTAVVDMAVDPGDILKFSGVAQYLTVDNSAVSPEAKFRACRKTAGEGLAEVIPF